MKRILFILSLLLACCQLSALVAAHVDRTQVSLGESLVLTIDTPSSASQPDLTVLDNDFHIYGSSTSSSTSIINGKMSSKHQTIITLMPKHIGTLTIPALSIGKEKTQAIKILVTKPTANNIGGNKSAAFLRASVSNTTAYIDSPVIFTLKLYYAQQIQGGNLLPTKKAGVDVKPYGKEQTYSAMINNKSYQVIEQHYLLSVDHAGKIEIPGITFTGSMVANNQNGFFGLPSSKPLSIVSNPVTLHVMPIPSKISPALWLPAENVTLHTQWAPQTNQLTVGQPITRTVTLTATGISASNLPDLNFPIPNNVNAYPDQSTTSQQIVNGKLIAKKIFKIAYVPTTVGKVTFPNSKVTWWNINTKQAEKADIPMVSYPVLPGSLSAQPPVIKQPSLAVTPAAPKTIVINKGTNPIWQWLTFLLAGLLIVLIILLLLKKSHRINHKKNSSVPSNDHSKVLLKRVRRACEQNHPKEIQQTIIDWAGAHWRDKTLLSLGEVAKKSKDEIVTQQLAELEKAIYTEVEYQTGIQLWECLNIFLASEKKTNTKGDLSPLYPE